MNKKSLVLEAARIAEMDAKDVEKVLDTLCEVISDRLTAGEKVSIINFGVFDTQKRQARVVLNNFSKKIVHVQPSIKPVFRAGSELKRKVNKSSVD